MRAVIDPAPDLAAARAGVWVRSARPPHFDRPYRVGFDVGGSKLGLDPDAAPADRAVPDRGVPDATAALAALTDTGALPRGAVREVGDGSTLATAVTTAGLVIGVIEHPHVAVVPSIGPGPGR